jgi:hypothetical protein
VSEEAAEVLHGVRVDHEVIIGEAAQAIAPGMRVKVVNDPPSSAAHGKAEGRAVRRSRTEAGPRETGEAERRSDEQSGEDASAAERSRGRA